MPRNIFVTEEKRVWMRLGDHAAVFDSDPAYARLARNAGGSIVRILRIWVADSEREAPRIHHYLGSVRRCMPRGWMSHRELVRLFRQATVTARLTGESGGKFRHRLSIFLRDYFGSQEI